MFQRPAAAPFDDLLEGGVDVKTTASRLGDSNPALLFKTYSQYIRDADKMAAERLDAALS